MKNLTIHEEKKNKEYVLLPRNWESNYDLKSPRHRKTERQGTRIQKPQVSKINNLKLWPQVRDVISPRIKINLQEGL